VIGLLTMIEQVQSRRTEGRNKACLTFPNAKSLYFDALYKSAVLNEVNFFR